MQQYTIYGRTRSRINQINVCFYTQAKRLRSSTGKHNNILMLIIFGLIIFFSYFQKSQEDLAFFEIFHWYRFDDDEIDDTFH